MSACIKEMAMEREVDRISVVLEGKQIKSMSEVKAIQITVPAPGGVRIGIMSGAGTDPDPVFGTGTNLMAIRERVGMDAGTVTREDEPARGNESGVYRREQSGKAEKFLKEFFIMKREFFSGNSLVCDDFSNTGMAVWEVFTFCRVFCRFQIFLCRGRSFFPSRSKAGFWSHRGLLKSK